MTWLRIGAAVLLGIAVRSLCFEDTFQDGRVYFYGTDAWYHMRRIVFALDHNFALPDAGAPDPYLNYPEGGRGYWGPLFDWSVAALLKGAGVGTRHAQETVAAIVPAVLGGLCAVPAFLLASLFWDRRVATLAAFFIAVLPGHMLYSQLGNLDHHVGESLFFGLILYHLLRVSQQGRRSIVLAAVFIVALYLLSPITSNVHVGVLWAASAARILLGDRAKEASRAAYAFFLGALLLLLPTLFWVGRSTEGIRPWGELPPWLMIERYSFAQPLLLLFSGLTLFLAARVAARQTDWKFWGAVAASALVLVLFLAPLRTGVDLLLRGNPDVQFTEETQPLLRFPGQPGLYFGVAVDSFSFGFLLFPFWLVYLFWKEPRSRSFAVYGTVVLGLVLLQLRFVHIFSYAMATALAVWTSVAFRRRKLWPVAALGIVVVLWPSLSWLDAFAHHQKYSSISKSFYDMCLWMKDGTPKDRGRPEYSVLAAWDLGHAILYLAERAVVADPFNHGFEASARYFTATDPQEAVAILKEKRVRYVIPVNLAHPYIQQIFLAYSRRTGDHPLRHGDWSQVFQMQLLRGKRGAEGHVLSYRAPDDSVLVFEFTPQ